MRCCRMESLGNRFMVFDMRDAAGGSYDDAFYGDWVRGMPESDPRRKDFDQLLVLENAEGGDAPVRCRIYNVDGSAAAQCGNGARCLAVYLHAGGQARRMSVKMGEATVEAEVGDGRVSAWLPPPSFDAESVGFTGAHDDGECVLATSAGALKFGLVSMGNPHAVTVLDDDDFPVREVGGEVQALAEFTEGVNVGFMRVVRRDAIRLRVVERGCGETRACGSGACAATVVGCRRGLLDGCVTVSLPGGELEIEWEDDGRVRMTTPLTEVFQGDVTTGDLDG